jgi:hypothetical protein
MHKLCFYLKKTLLAAGRSPLYTPDQGKRFSILLRASPETLFSSPQLSRTVLTYLRYNQGCGPRCTSRMRELIALTKNRAEYANFTNIWTVFRGIDLGERAN